MTIKRKEVHKDKKPKVKEPKKPRIKLDVNRLTDAIVEGVWSVPLGQDFMVSKKVSGRQQQSICTFKEMLNEKTVSCWDKTLERWLAFSIDDLEKFGIIVKKI